MANTETFGLKLYLGDSGSPNVYTQIAGVTAIPQLFSFNRSQIDTTEIADTVKTFLAGQLDPGEVTFDLKFDPGETTHDESTGLIFTMITRGTFSWCLEIPASNAVGAVATYVYFQAVTTALAPAGAQDDVIRASAVTLKISGLPVFTSTAPATS